MIYVEFTSEEIAMLSGAIGALAIQAKGELPTDKYEALLERCQKLLIRLVHTYNTAQMESFDDTRIN